MSASLPVDAPKVDGQPEPVLLILADISGYTRFMTSNAKSLRNSRARSPDSA